MTECEPADDWKKSGGFYAAFKISNMEMRDDIEEIAEK